MSSQHALHGTAFEDQSELIAVQNIVVLGMSCYSYVTQLFCEIIFASGFGVQFKPFMAEDLIIHGTTSFWLFMHLLSAWVYEYKSVMKKSIPLQTNSNM